MESGESKIYRMWALLLIIMQGIVLWPSIWSQGFRPPGPKLRLQWALRLRPS